MKRLLLLAVLLAPVLMSCEKEEPSIDFGGSVSVEMPAEGGSTTVSLTTNYGWEASTADPWIQVSPASGMKGYATLTLRVLANDSGKARKGSVTVTCQTLNRGIQVSQQAKLTQSLVIKHDNPSFRIPSITGSGVTGKVDWGDGAEENYASSLFHNYASGGNHTVTIRLNGADAFELESVAGVTAIDLSSFGIW